MSSYRHMARPQLDALMQARRGFSRSHPVFRAAQVLSHLSYRGAHEVVGWYESTKPVELPAWANEWGITEGMALPDAMATAFDVLHRELALSLNEVDRGTVAACRLAVAEVQSALGFGLGPMYVQWPTIEWVKTPVDLDTGDPNGSPIAMRHFPDCSHWYRNDDGTWVGDPPFLASDEQMRLLSACKDCTRAASRASHDSFGPRLLSPPDHADSGEPEGLLPVLLDLDETDATANIRIRREQAHLRKHLLGGRSEVACAVCGREFPDTLLVAAHIVPRRHLGEAERLDFASTAMLLCALGCDALFERGYVVVDDSGTVCGGANSPSLIDDLVSALVGRQCAAFNRSTADRFRRHAEIHSARSSNSGP